jgi:hypothetical protein
MFTKNAVSVMEVRACSRSLSRKILDWRTMSFGDEFFISMSKLLRWLIMVLDEKFRLICSSLPG